jgi:O-antigen biosynthesis protein WbqP
MISRIIAIVMLVFLSPFFFLIFLWIWVEDGRPAFFKQKRFGANNILFWIYKFRSMKKNTPNVATHLLQDPDSYLLVSGKLLRKLSLDELPNLINIAKGEMVFVGPRPALYNQMELMELRRKNGIDNLKPGITGWAQVNGRDELTDVEKVKYEAEYLASKSFVMDSKIIFLTFFNVIKLRGVAH